MQPFTLQSFQFSKRLKLLNWTFPFAKKTFLNFEKSRKTNSLHFFHENDLKLNPKGHIYER